MKTKQYFIFIFTSLMAALFLTSCFSKDRHYSSKNPAAVLNIALRAGVYADVIKGCIPNFEKNFNIQCNIIELSEDELHTKIANNHEGKYDLCMVDGSWMAEFTAKGILANLTEYGYNLDDDIIEATKKICYHNGSTFLAPYYGNVTVLLYNKLMVQEAGFSPEDIESLEDIVKICEFQAKRHNLGFMYRGDTANNIVVDFLPILLSRGTYVVDENNNPTVNTQEFAEAMYFYLKLIKTGRAANKEDLIAAISNKSAAMGIGWPGWDTPTKNSSMDYIALTGKFRDDRPSYNSNIYGIWALGVPEKSKNKKKAVVLLDYLMNKDVQKATVKHGGVPCRYSSLKDPEILKKFPQYKAVCEALEGGVYRPVMEEWPAFYTILSREMKLIIDGKKSVFEGLEAAQKDLEKLLSKNQ